MCSLLYANYLKSAKDVIIIYTEDHSGYEYDFFSFIIHSSRWSCDNMQCTG